MAVGVGGGLGSRWLQSWARSVQRIPNLLVSLPSLPLRPPAGSVRRAGINKVKQNNNNNNNNNNNGGIRDTLFSTTRHCQLAWMMH